MPNALPVCSLLLAGFLALATAASASAQADALRSRIDNVLTLIETSSGARQIEASGVEAAVQRRDMARSLHRQSVSALEAGDRDGATRLLGEASRTMFEAVRLAGAPQSIEDKQQFDFDSRAKSIEVLFDALQRISGEKGTQAKVATRLAQAQATVAEAQKLRGSGDPVAGRKKLDEAYHVVKLTIEELRGGETLVRTLSFTSKREEYAYELDRNDTHKMLVEVLTSEKQKQRGVKQMVEKFLVRASSLRAQAEKEAGSGDHARAVSTLESSTKALIRAIRSTGTYIPG